jgi:glycosyltransferase involved in cell wall biosynthesis
MPVYNGEKYLKCALDSILKQDYADFELILSDNASTDATEQICADYASRDKRIRYFRNESNIGAARNYNRVFELSHGTFFKWLSHDDECHPAMLRKCVEVMEATPGSVSLVYPRTEIIDEQGVSCGPSPDSIEATDRQPYKRLAKMLYHLGLGHPLWGIIRSEYLRKTRGMTGAICNDFILLSELVMLGKIIEVPEFLLKLRIHSGNAAKLHPDRNKLLLWLDPSNRVKSKPGFLPPKEQLYLDYLKAVYYVPIPALEKIPCYFAVPTAVYGRQVLHLTGGPRTWLKRLRGIPAVGNPPGKEGHGDPAAIEFSTPAKIKSKTLR